MAESEKNKLELVQETVDKLMELIGLEATAEVIEDKENDAVNVEISSENEKGLLIGKRGESLFAIQSIIQLIVRQEYGDWVRVLVNIGDWREKQEDYLTDLAKQAAQRALDTGEEQTLYNLNPNQRRIVHTVLSEYEEVETESQGEGHERYLVVRPK